MVVHQETGDHTPGTVAVDQGEARRQATHELVASLQRVRKSLMRADLAVAVPDIKEHVQPSSNPRFYVFLTRVNILVKTVKK